MRSWSGHPGAITLAAKRTTRRRARERAALEAA
jgi:hypothetical protein